MFQSHFQAEARGGWAEDAESMESETRWPPRPRADRSFFRAQALGNDYLVFRSGTDWTVSGDAVRTVCDRHRGVGSDGIVWVDLTRRGSPPAGSPILLRMFNPDGSEFERSGNGLRIAALYLRRWGRAAADPILVRVGGDTIGMRILHDPGDGPLDVEVTMGTARFGHDAVGVDSRIIGEDGLLTHPILGPVRVYPVSIGNPHAVVFTDRTSDDDLVELGSWLTTHPAFTHGTNVQLAHLRTDGTLRIRIWERGVGPTTASGTSACAAAAAAVEAGRLEPGLHSVYMDGGEFQVRVSVAGEIVLRGPVQPVCSGELDLSFVRSLGGGE